MPAGAAVHRCLYTCPWYTEAKSVGVYISFAEEVETVELIESILGRKPEVAGGFACVEFMAGAVGQVGLQMDSARVRDALAFQIDRRRPAEELHHLPTS